MNKDEVALKKLEHNGGWGGGKEDDARRSRAGRGLCRSAYFAPPRDLGRCLAPGY